MLFIKPHSLLSLPAFDYEEDRRVARKLSTASATLATTSAPKANDRSP